MHDESVIARDCTNMGKTFLRKILGIFGVGRIFASIVVGGIPKPCELAMASSYSTKINQELAQLRVMASLSLQLYCSWG